MFANSSKSDALPTKIIIVVSLAATSAIAFSAYDFTRHYLLTPSIPDISHLPQTAAPQEKIPVDAIAKTPFFGAPDASSLSAAAVNAQPTPLHLELKGVLTSAQNNESGAIIAEPGKPEKLYHSGDAVLQDTKLVAVFPDRVLLSRNGKYEVLNFKPENADTPPAQANKP